MLSTGNIGLWESFFKMTIDETLKQAVNDAIGKGWTIRGLAAASGVPNPTISRWLRGERTISLESAQLLCEFFGAKLTKPKIPPAG